jgi:glycosyltransferase involved in cell wall biosynthesis
MNKPNVSIIVPCYNEKNTIGLLLEAILEQNHSLSDMEVVIADGLSTDGTREAVTAFSSAHPMLQVRVVDNPARVIPAALNKAIGAAHGDVIIRLDAHSVPNTDYVKRCLDVLNRTGAANVGGVWDIRAVQRGWIAKSIAVAASNRLGAGDARYRTSGAAGEVDTVPFGAFQREWVDRVGGFDEGLLANEDYEFNVRIRQAGGIIWFDPSIRSIYFARPGLLALAKQYFRYGYWKARMLIRYPKTLRWRQALPPLFVLANLLLLVASLRWDAARVLLAGLLSMYIGVTIIAGLYESFRRREPALLVGFPLAIWVMHLAWGGAFLLSLFGSFVGGLRGFRRA